MGPEKVIVQMFRADAIIRAYWKEVVLWEGAEWLESEWLEQTA